MKAEELMIGDWVNITEKNLSGNYQVKEVKRYKVYGVVVGRSYFMWDECIEPIPLTPEILEKNGFEFVEDSKISISCSKLLDDNCTSINIQFYDNRSCYFRLCYYGIRSYELRKHIPYVHELQHALRLCGLNDMADDFEVE